MAFDKCILNNINHLNYKQTVLKTCSDLLPVVISNNINIFFLNVST